MNDIEISIMLITPLARAFREESVITLFRTRKVPLKSLLFACRPNTLRKTGFPMESLL